jgi:Flp pilus assembly pilin Flp
VFTKLREPAGNERGATLVEYALVVGLIGGVACVILSIVGHDVAGIFTSILAAFQPPP